MGVHVALCRSLCCLGRQVAELEDWLRVVLEQGKHVACWQKVRLLHFSYDHAMKYGVTEAGTQASSGGHQDLLEEAVGLYRRALATAKQKTSASWMWYHGFWPDSTTMMYVLVSFNNGSGHLLANTMS